MLNLVEMLVMTSGAVELYAFVIFCKKKILLLEGCRKVFLKTAYPVQYFIAGFHCN